jgi:CrcB protein
VRPTPAVRSILAVLVGGVFGTALRLGLDNLFAQPDKSFPLSTLIVNVLGSLALGFLVARVWPSAADWIRAGIGPGLLGGFTTFSAVMVSMVTLASTGRVVLALVYLLVTFLLGFGAAALGLVVGLRMTRGGAPGNSLPDGPDLEVDE